MGQDDGSRWKFHPFSSLRLKQSQTCPGHPNRLEEPEKALLLESAPGSDAGGAFRVVDAGR